MAATLHIHRLAQKEIDKALRWYRKRSLGLAERLRSGIREAIRTVQESPVSWPEQLHGARFYQLKVFPYILVYFVDGEEVTVISIQHTSRRPGYWKRRVTK